MDQNRETEFNEMYVTLFPKMVKYANNLCRNREEAEDITQEAFMKAYRSFDKINLSFKVENWLMKIVYHTFLDVRRMKGRRIQALGEAIEGTDLTLSDLPDNGPSPEDRLMEQSIDPDLRRALRNLDPKSRDLFKKAFIEERSHSEISQEMGIETGTLRSRLHRITMRLRKDLKGSKFAAFGA